MMLCEELRDDDIPHRTTIRNRVLEVWDEYLDQLTKEMQVHLRAVSSFYQTSLLYYGVGIFRKDLVYNGHVVRSK
jgi:hypothetical protein